MAAPLYGIHAMEFKTILMLRATIQLLFWRQQGTALHSHKCMVAVPAVGWVESSVLVASEAGSHGPLRLALQLLKTFHTRDRKSVV